MIPEIPKMEEWGEKVFSIDNDDSFGSIALELFHFQFSHNPVYRSFCRLVHREPPAVKTWKEIPFLPISLFKSHEVVTTRFQPDVVFESSGTTGSVPSRHQVKAAALYEKSFLTGFDRFYGSPSQYCVLGLLPSYLERSQSSLVFMVNELIQRSGHPQSGFYLYNFEDLHRVLRQLEEQKQPTILFGVTYALLDFAEQFPVRLEHTIVMETGGMKGRKKELTRQELHHFLKEGFQTDQIHAEYGMTELLSQAYAKDHFFATPPWMKLLLRDETDPFALLSKGSGAMNVIDLANVYSCAFIATEDVARISDRGVEILGRLDNSDVRGCSLMVGEEMGVGSRES